MQEQEQQITTKQINTLLELVLNLRRQWEVAAQDTDELAAAHEWCAMALALLYRWRRRGGRRQAAGSEFAELLASALREWKILLQLVEDLTPQRARYAAMGQRLAAAEAENARLRAELERRPTTTSVEIPAQTVTIRSPVEQEILRLIAALGLARSWRIVQRVMAAGLTDNANSVRNAINRLKKQGHIADYTWNGKAQTWTPTAGGGRQLVRLAATGCHWAEQAFQITAAPCELDAMVTRHKGVSHAVAILEAHDHLTAAGCTVDAMPEPLLFDADEPWGARVEPDLLVEYKGTRYLVEVQREVDGRNTEKWGKALSTGAALMLITLNAQACEKQAFILREAIRRCELPAGEIYLASLEAMESADWHWVVLRS